MNRSSISQHPLGDLGFEAVSRTLHDLGFEPLALRQPQPEDRARRRIRALLVNEERFSPKATAAAKAVEQEPTLRPKILQASNRPQPVGAVDSRSGRTITQLSDNPAMNQALATEAMRVYRSGLESAIRKISGAKLAASRDAKNPRRLAEKIELESQPAQTVNDYGAAQISVDSPQAKDAVIASVRRTFPVVRVQDHFAYGDPKYGYRSYSMQLQMPNGASQELQIVPKEVFEINRAEHKNYKAARNAELAGKNAEAVQAAAKTQNDAAMAIFNARNRRGSLTKGSVVTLPDGSTGKVSYADSNMRIARVRTGDGRNLTLRQNQLKMTD